MRTADRDRRGPGIACICAALILGAALFLPASALDAGYYVADNGSVFHAEVEIEDVSGYEFFEPGMLGEKVSVDATNISLTDSSGSKAEFEEGWDGITFDQGNYTISYDQEFDNKDFRVMMDRSYNITLHLPSNYGVSNPLLGSVSTGGTVNSSDNFTDISWEMKRYAEVRFYDSFQEKMLYAFGSFWIVLVIIFLIPYIIARRKH